MKNLHRAALANRFERRRDLRSGRIESLIRLIDGEPRQIGIRENVVIDVFGDWIHYTTDTSEGASGAPVLNDQWQLAALHHAAIQYRTEDGRRVIVDEGLRISSIMRLLAERIG